VTVKKKTRPAAQSVAAPKPPKKLIPRTAPKPVELAPADVVVEAPPPAPAVAAAPATAAATARARPPRKPSREDESVARYQGELADALQKAQAIKYDQPKMMKPPAADAKKPAKARKPRLVRDSYAMPEAEYAVIGELKKRLATLEAPARKSELLRGGIALLAALGDADLKAAMARVERIKTGRPAKHGKK